MSQSQNDKARGTVQIVTKDLIRSLRIPAKDPSQETLILSPAEMQRILTASQDLKNKESEAQREANQRKEVEIKAAQERKKKICESNRKLKKPHTQEEIALCVQKSLGRTNILNIELQCEVRKVNKVHMEFQCQAIREAQINEKKKIQATMAEEEKRLDTMMEKECCKEVENTRKINELRKLMQKNDKQQIYHQIQQHQDEKNILNNTKKWQSQRIRENQEKMKLEDLKALEKKKADQRCLQKEFICKIDENMSAKKQMKQEERLADMRENKYIENKFRLRTKRDAEQSCIKEEREHEQFLIQEKAKTMRAERFEINNQRIQEQKDSEWERKKKDVTRKKAQDVTMLNSARLEQVRSKEQLMVVERERQKAEYDVMAKLEQDSMVKQQEEEEKRHQKAQQHKEALLQQIKEHGRLAKQKCKDTFKEAFDFTEEGRDREVFLDIVKKKKLKDLKASGIPEKYCTQFERKVFNRRQK
ncbi:cilia- and flagella-associated protein 45-like [Labrus mixtus]|uniref:cilia- and flagella-associated protein 45-like n=1 Tax=Labrus mixtus TaxID=508554 RepID=UPI0029C0BCBE|nr:cilia- and flagella-associated protein 45-like [Labrus mixtus]